MMAFGFRVKGCRGCLEQEKAALLNLKAAQLALASWTENEDSKCCDGSMGRT